MKISTDKIKLRILVPHIAALVLILASCIFGVLNHQRNQMRDRTLGSLAEVQQAFQEKLKRDTELIIGLMYFIEEDPNLKSVWLAQNREALRIQALPIYDNIRSKHGVTHFYFHQKDSINYLRMHHPEEFGDKIGRFTMMQAADTQALAWGLEIGPRMDRLTLRIVNPWRINNELAGFLELGEEIEHIAPALSQLLGVDLVFAVKKGYLDRARWEESNRILGRRDSWDQFSDFAILDRTQESIPSGLSSFLQNQEIQDTGEQIFSIKEPEGNRIWHGGFVPLIDAGNREIGKIIVLRDITKEESWLVNLIFLLISVTAITGGSLTLIYYLYVGGVENRLVKIHDLEKEIVQRKAAQEKLALSNKLLETIDFTQSVFIGEDAINKMFSKILSGILDYSGGEYGFIGEVLHTPKGDPYLKTCAITNISWNRETRDLYEKHSELGMEFYNMDTLFGRVITGGKILISDNPSTDPRRGGLPPGHPAMNSFMGVPIFQGGELLGMVGLANKPGGYRESHANDLKPILSTCATLIQSNRNYKRRILLESSLKRSEANYANAERIAELGNFEWDLERDQVQWSPALFCIFGVSPDEFDPNRDDWRQFIHPDDRESWGAWFQNRIRERKFLNHEIRIVSRNGQEKNLYIFGEFELDSSGKVKRVSGTVQDISERKENERKLKFYSSELERSNRDLEEFASMASHDLQEPLRKILIFEDRLRQTLSAPEGRVMEFMNRIRTTATRLQLMIDSLLEFSKLVRKDPVFQRVNLEDVVHEVLNDLEEQIAQTKATVRVDGLPILEADPLQMHQLLQNLIGNGLKYRKSDTPPVIRLASCRDASGQWQISIEDNGIGFQEKFSEKIFKPFERLHGHSSPYQGMGLGLAICTKIVTRHGGKILVKSQPQAGSIFQVVLPEKQSLRNGVSRLSPPPPPI